MNIETVKVVANNEGGYMIINKSDMTPEHKIYKPKPARKKAVRKAKS